MAKKKKTKSISWTGDRFSYWSITQIPISKEQVKERKKNPHRYFPAYEYEIKLKVPMCDAINFEVTEKELVDLIIKAELILKRKSLPQ